MTQRPFLALALALPLLSSACDSDDSDSGATPNSSGSSGSESDGDESSGAGSVGEDSTGASSIGGDSTGVGSIGDDSSDSGEALPEDCSCSDPRASETCLPVAEALPGCDFSDLPCETISEVLDERTAVEVGPASAVECVVSALAAGETPSFTIDGESYISGFETEYVALEGRRYVTSECSYYDSLSSQGVSTDSVAAPEYFAACIEDNPDTLSLYMCMRGGLTPAPSGQEFPACGS